MNSSTKKIWLDHWLFKGLCTIAGYILFDTIGVYFTSSTGPGATQFHFVCLAIYGILLSLIFKGIFKWIGLILAIAFIILLCIDHREGVTYRKIIAAKFNEKIRKAKIGSEQSGNAIASSEIQELIIKSLYAKNITSIDSLFFCTANGFDYFGVECSVTVKSGDEGIMHTQVLIIKKEQTSWNAAKLLYTSLNIKDILGSIPYIDWTQTYPVPSK